MGGGEFRTKFGAQLQIRSGSALPLSARVRNLVSCVYETPARPWANVGKNKTPDSGYEPSFGTGTRMRGYGNVESNDLHVCLEWLAHLFSS